MNETPETPENPDTEATATEPEETNRTEQADEAEDKGGNGNAEAAKLRHQRNEARTERDEIAAKLQAAEQRLLSYAITQAGIDPRAWELSNVDDTEIRDEDGNLDAHLLIDRARQIRDEIYGSGPRPNRQQGQPSERPASTLRDAFNPRSR